MRKVTADQEKVYADCRKSFAASETMSFDSLRGSSILITGASGFVGTWLLSALAFLNDVHGFDTRIVAVARHPSAVERRAPFLSGRNDLSWIASDVRQLSALPEDLEWLVHAAGVPDSRHHATSPIETASVIGEGTLRVLRLAEQLGKLRRILHFSSGLVDGTAGRTGIAGPTAVYVEAKRFSEVLCFAFRTQAKLPIVITRPFTFLGPFQDLASPWAANNFLRAAVEGQPLKVLGDGRATRTYLYGSDMAVLALGQLLRGESGEIHDLGGLEALSMSELATTVVAQARRPLEIRINLSARSSEADRFLPNMASSLQRLGAKPAFSIAEAIDRSLDWYS